MKPSTLAIFEAQYDAVVESIYRAGGGVVPWSEPLTRICEMFNLASLQIISIAKVGEAVLFRYESGDPAGGNEPAGDDRAASGPERSETEALPHIVPVSEDEESRVTLVSFPAARRAALSQGEKSALARLAEQFARALALMKTLDTQSHHVALAKALLDKLGQPIFVLDRGGRIAYRNRHADGLLGRADLVVERNGRLVCRDSISDIELSGAIEQFAYPTDHASPRRVMLKLMRDDGTRIAAALQPMQERPAAGGLPTQLIFTIFEPSGKIEIDCAVLSAAFDLTPAEAAIASLVANGKSPIECSEEMGVKISTVRSQLVSLYGKTGASGHADLIRTVLSTASAPLALGGCYPQRPIRVIVPFSAGGTTDMIMRALAHEMTKSLGQRVIIDYQPGDATVAGVAAGARAAPDGYTLVSIATSFAVNHSLVRSLPYDSLHDLQPVSLMTRTPLVLVGSRRIPARTLPELVDYLQGRPNRLRYGSLGRGTLQHVAAEAWQAVAGVGIMHVPFGNQTEAISALLSGSIDLLFGNFLDVLPYMRPARVKCFGVTTLERLSLAPDLPTIAEQGFPGFEFYAWFGLKTPAGVPAEIVDLLNREIAHGLLRTKLGQSLGSRGMDAIGGTTHDFGQFLKTEMVRYGQLVKDVPLKS